jgi:hypothetical protein
MSGWRVIPVPALLLAEAPKMRAWQREVRDGHLSVFAGPEPDRFHLSISHRTSDGRAAPGRYPTWDEIHDARYRFCPLDKTMAMLLPPQDEYVNLHATTFHLWEVPLDAPTESPLSSRRRADAGTRPCSGGVVHAGF